MCKAQRRVNVIELLSKLPTDLVRYTFDFLDFTYNTYVITTGKKNNKLILIQKPISFAVGRNDDIFFIT